VGKGGKLLLLAKSRGKFLELPGTFVTRQWEVWKANVQTARIMGESSSRSGRTGLMMGINGAKAKLRSLSDNDEIGDLHRVFSGRNKDSSG
jgi:hypothetical protein